MKRLDRQSRELMHDLCSLADTMVDGLTTLGPPSTQSFARAAYLAFFVRVVRIFRAFAYLAGRGYGPEAELLIRPFFDTIVDWLYIESDPENLGRRYLMHEAASQLEWIRDQGYTAEEQRYVSEHGDVAEQYCSLYCKGKNRVPTDWCNLSMEQKASKAGLGNYYRIFRDLSNKLHNNPLAMAQYIDTSDPSILKLKTEPDFADLGRKIAFMCLGLHLCLEKADEHFELDSESEIEALGEQVRRHAKV